MNQSRLWTLGAVLIGIALIAGTWFLGVSPRLNDANQANENREAAATVNDLHRQTLLKLKQEHERLDEIVAELDVRQLVIPEVPEIARFYTELAAAAGRASVSVTSVSFGEPTAYVPPALPDETVGVAGQLAESGLYIVPVTIEVKGGGSESALNFIAALQHMPRYVLVQNVAVVMDSTGQSAIIQAQMFGLSADTIPQPEPTPPTAPTE